MRTWETPIVLPGDGPLFHRIAKAIANDIERGRLNAGDALPSSRALADALEVNRNTVVAALDELRAQGFVVARERSGVVVADAWKNTVNAPRPRASVGFDLPRALPPWPGVLDAPPGTLALQSGVPDLRLLPVDELTRAWRRAAKRGGRALLGYSNPYGHPDLRAAIARMLNARRGLAASPETILVVRGSQMALDLVGRLLVKPGDVIAVEALGYPPAWRSFLASGARLLPIAVDAEGIDVDALARERHIRNIRFVYVTPHHQYPTTVSLSARRRRDLLAYCAKERVAILEDDYDHELVYEGHPLLPLAAADQHGTTIYVGTLSKILAPGLRLGFIHAPKPVIDELAALRAHTDRQGDLVLEAAVAELLDEGLVLRHANRLKRAGQSRRDTLVAELRAAFGERLQFDVPRGGMALWVRALIDVELWAHHALKHKVAFATARRYALDGVPRPFARLGFAALDERELKEAVRRLAAAANSRPGRPT